MLDWLEVHELHEVVAGDSRPSVGRRHRRLQVERDRGVGRRDRRRRSRPGARARRRPRALAGSRRLEGRRASTRACPRRSPGRAPGGRAGARAARRRAVPDVGSSRISSSGRPRSCSRITYAATRSSCEDARRGRRTGCGRTAESLATGDCILTAMRRRSSSAGSLSAWLRGVDDGGAEERVVVWIERRRARCGPSAARSIPQHRSSDEPRRDDYVFEGYELDDALEHANSVPRGRLAVSEDDGRRERCGPSRARSCSGRSSAGSSDRGADAVAR